MVRLSRPVHISYFVRRVNCPYGSYPFIGDEISALARMPTWRTITVVEDWVEFDLHPLQERIPLSDCMDIFAEVRVLNAHGLYLPCHLSLPCVHCQLICTCIARNTEAADDSVESQQLPSLLTMF